MGAALERMHLSSLQNPSHELALLLKMHAAGLNRGEFIPGGLIKGGAAKPADAH